MESTLSVVVTYDAGRGAPAVLGRHAIADAGLYSVCLAIQNLWLAATAEGLGVGWVSFYREPFVSELLGIPDGVRPVAWLCLGPVSHLEETPDLERHGWRQRRPLSEAIHHERWTEKTGGTETPFQLNDLADDPARGRCGVVGFDSRRTRRSAGRGRAPARGGPTRILRMAAVGTATSRPKKPPRVPPSSRASITRTGWSFTTRCMTSGEMKWLSICWTDTMTSDHPQPR